MTTTTQPTAREPVLAPGRGSTPAVLPGATRHRVFAAALVALAGGLLANTTLGPLGLDRIDYRFSRSVLDQLVGLELVTVALVVPLALVAAGLSWRGRPVGPALAFGPAAYTAYMFAQYVLGPEYATYGPAVLGHLALFASGGTIAVAALLLLAREGLPALSRRRSRWTGVVVLAMAAFVVARYLPAVSGATDRSAIPAEFAAARTFYWSIVLLDLGVVVPAALAAGLLLVRRLPGATVAMVAVVGWFALVPPSVAAMAVVMLVDGDPHASGGQAGMLSAVAVLFAGFAAWAFRPVLNAGRRA